MSENFFFYRLIGRLGNQLFIIFTALAFSKKYGRSIFFEKDQNSVYYLENLLKKIKEKTHGAEKKHSLNKKIKLYQSPENFFDENHYSVVHKFIEENINENIKFNIYFHCRKLFDDIRHEIPGYFKLEKESDRKLFETELKAIKEISENKEKIFIHIRRGDYVGSHREFPFDNYYTKAIEIFKEKYGDKNCFFVVFSDDLRYCETKFQNEKYFKHYRICKINKEIVELMLMAQMDHAIITNSTFSWWGAYLMEIQKELINNAESPVITSPAYWFNKTKKEALRNISRHNWIFLDNS